MLPGDDASCLNLYEPRNPRILGASRAFIASGRFAFQASMPPADAERANPWLLLERPQADGAVPVIADANSMTYVLHKSLGDEIVIDRGGRPVRLRLVAALRDSIFQSELLMSEANFLRLFPEQQGYRLLLVRRRAERVADVSRHDRRRRSATSAPTPRSPRNGWRSSTASRTPTSPRSRRSAGSVCCSARSAWPRCCCATCSNAGGSWRCSARSATGASHFFVIVLAENALLLAGGLVDRRGVRRPWRSRRPSPSAAAGCHCRAAESSCCCGVRDRFAILASLALRARDRRRRCRRMTLAASE